MNKGILDLIRWRNLDQVITGVVTTGEIIGGIFFATDELFRVEELAVCSSPHLIDDSRLKINKHCTRNMLSCTCFTEKGVESIVASTKSGVTGHLAIGLHRFTNKI